MDLSSNKLSKGFAPISKCKNLKYLNISENDISNIDEIKCLKEITNLDTLQIDQIGDGSVEDFRASIFNEFKNLKFLNGLDIELNEPSSCSESDYDEYDEDGSEDASDTRLDVLLGKDLSDELDDSEFQLEEAALLNADATNSINDEDDSEDDFDDDSEQEKPSSSSAVQKKSGDKRPISEVDEIVSPSKKPKV